MLISVRQLVRRSATETCSNHCPILWNFVTPVDVHLLHEAPVLGSRPLAPEHGRVERLLVPREALERGPVHPHLHRHSLPIKALVLRDKSEKGLVLLLRERRVADA